MTRSHQTDGGVLLRKATDPIPLLVPRKIAKIKKGARCSDAVLASWSSPEGPFHILTPTQMLRPEGRRTWFATCPQARSRRETPSRRSGTVGLQKPFQISRLNRTQRAHSNMVDERDQRLTEVAPDVDMGHRSFPVSVALTPQAFACLPGSDDPV